jgi:glycosyltransferase involved in cell wall biosynthesis
MARTLLTVPPDVSVVIPTRDRWSLLSSNSLPSALAQEHVEVEVIVVDDGSRDGTSERLAKLGDPRVRGIRLDPARGAAAARNEGIAAARAEWVAFLDDDDLWSPRKLRAQLDAAGAAQWGYTGAFVVDEALRATDVLPLAEPSALAEALRHGNVLAAGSSAVIARTDALREVGGMDEGLAFGYDWDLWRKLASRSPPSVCPELLVATLEHAQRSRMRNRRLLVRETDELVRRGGGDHGARRAAAEWIANDQFRAGKHVAAAALYLRAAVVFRSPGNLPPAVGALFGRPGMRVASRILAALGGDSHLDLERRPPPTTPEWLEAFGGRVVA